MMILEPCNDFAFQSTPLQEGRPELDFEVSKLRKFQSTPLQEGRRPPRPAIRASRLFQSTPLQEGRLFGYYMREVAYAVSIHAPAGGATCILPTK